MKNSNEPAFSIIIPVFNTEKWIGQCVDSISRQTLQDYEVIFIDDGSTDHSGSLCDEYERADPLRYRVVHSENRGQLHARLLGMKQARGRYYVFVDSDDTIEPNALSFLSNCFNKYDCDCVVYGFRRVNDGKISAVYTDSKDELIQDKNEIYRRCLLNQRYNSMCRKAIRASVQNRKDYSSYFHLRFSEDLLQSVEVLEHCRSVFFTNEVLYNYRINPQSVTEKVKKQPKIDMNFTVSQIVLSFLIDHSVLSEIEMDQYRQRMIQVLLLPLLKEIALSDSSFHDKRKKYQHVRENPYYKNFLCRIRYLAGYRTTDKVIYYLFVNKMDTLLIALLSQYYVLTKQK